MDIRVRRSKLSVIVVSVISIIMGFLTMTNPTSATMFVTLAAGWLLLAGGLVNLVSAFMNFNILLSQMELIEGLVSFFLGIMIVNWPQFFVAWIFILIGLALVFFGFNSLYLSNAARVLLGQRRTGTVLGSALIIVLGFLVMFSPFVMADATMILAGVALVYAGIIGLLEGFRMKSDTKSEQ